MMAPFTQELEPPAIPGRVWMPPVLQGDFLTFFGLALLSVVCQASGRGLKTPRGRYAVRRTKVHIGSESLDGSSPGTGFLVLNIEVLAA